MTTVDYTATNGTSSAKAKMELTKALRIQLSNPAQLDKIDKLRELGVAKFVALPQLVVVGDQSSGKSSVLEAVMELPLPRDSGLCTRFATNITFRRSPQRSIAVSIIPGPTRSPAKAEELKAYKKFVKSWESPDQENLRVLSNPRSVQTSSKIELSGPDRENLSIIDIPGIFRTATEGVTTKNDIDLVKNMVRDWIQDERTIILAVVSANVDIATQEILTMAEKADPKGLRTLGVLTKPDLVDDGAEHQVIDLVRGKRNKLKLGYCIVRNCSQKELDTDSDSRTLKERKFFNTEPWSSLPKDRVGRLTSCKKQLIKMGADRETSEQQRHYLEGIAAQFEAITKDALSANYCRHEIFEEDDNLRLPTLVVDRSDRFTRDIQRRGHTVPSKEIEVAEDDNLEESGGSKVKDTAFTLAQIAKEDGNEVTLDSKSSEYPELLDVLRLHLHISPIKDGDILAWIETQYRKARGYSLEVMDPNILPILWQKQSSNWRGITLSFMNDIIIFVHDFICRLLRHVCSDGKVRSGLLEFIMEDVLGKYATAIKHVEFILRVESHGTLLTKNHYFGDTLKKIRNNRMINEAKKSEFTTTMMNGASQRPFKAVKVSHLADVTSKGNLEHAVEDIHAVLHAYYKVVMKRFVDTVVAQGADFYLLTSDESPLKILTPLFISSMTSEQLDEIAGEDLITKRERQELKEEIQALEHGRKLLRG
ncbi:hypothetical protein V500_11238 [Pseudogymnoascus sp. VKM F-4518 (FW-2643)]|nr:hypothetical protein V500_11238 [Pseudogymnoascus sp. VKM F-4518 (FW-2643)]